MAKTRQQLTLFVEDAAATVIESIRAKFNPVQFALIKSHVTLCREDEIMQMDQVRSNLLQLNRGPIEMKLGAVERFAEGKGVFIRLLDQTGGFQELRSLLLKNGNKEPRIHDPHLTLIHPRNATCTDQIFATILATRFPATLRFSKISLIEQQLGEKWFTKEEFNC